MSTVPYGYLFTYIKLPIGDTFGLLMRDDCPLASLPAIHPEDVKDYPVWVAHQQIGSNVLAGWLGKDAENLNIIATFNLITTPSMMIEQGFGMAFTFDKLVNTSGESKLCFRPLTPPVNAELYLVWKKYEMFTGVSKIFLEHIQNTLY